MAEGIDKRKKIEEIRGVLNELHEDIAYVTLFDMHGSCENVCLDSSMFIEQDAWLPGTKFLLEYYEMQFPQGVSLTQEFRILEYSKESDIPSPPIQSLKESLDKIDEYTPRRKCNSE